MCKGILMCTVAKLGHKYARCRYEKICEKGMSVAAHAQWRLLSQSKANFDQHNLLKQDNKLSTPCISVYSIFHIRIFLWVVFSAFQACIFNHVFFVGFSSSGSVFSNTAVTKFIGRLSAKTAMNERRVYTCYRVGLYLRVASKKNWRKCFWSLTIRTSTNARCCQSKPAYLKTEYR